MARGIGEPVAEPLKIAPHQLRVGSGAVDAGDEILLDDAAHLGLEIAFEGQVDVTRREHEAAVAARLAREADDKPAGPVRQGAGPVGPAPDADGHRAAHRHGQVGAGRRGHLHCCGLAAGGNSGANHILHRRVWPQARKNLGMLVGNRHDAGPGLQDGRCFGRMHQPLDRQVDDEVACLQLRQCLVLAGQRVRRAGRPDHRHARSGRLALHIQDRRRNLHLGERGGGKHHIHLPRQTFCQDRDCLAVMCLAHLEQPDEGVLPVRLE